MSEHDTTIRVWVVKYALRDGIQEKYANFLRGKSHDYVNCPGIYISMRLGRDAFTNEADAIKAAEAMLVKKIAALDRQIAKLRNITFSAADSREPA